MKKGFTLIELLVVVIIIGILAAVALPQYQNAVDKARFTQMVVLSKAMKDASEEYRMANGDYTSDFTALTLDLPQGGSFNSNGHWVLKNQVFSLLVNYPRVMAQDRQLKINYSLDLDGTSTPGRRTCTSYLSNNYKGDTLCKSLGGASWVSGCSGEEPCHTFVIP